MVGWEELDPSDGLSWSILVRKVDTGETSGRLWGGEA